MPSPSNAVILALMVAAPVSAQTPPGQPAGAAQGPQGASNQDQRYDAVGYAGVTQSGDPQAITAASAALPPGSFAEVTSLDTGRTILVLIAGAATAPGTLVALSQAAAQQLGIAEGARSPVRIRAAVASPMDAAALHAGRAAGARLDAPPALLIALRAQLPDAATNPPQQPPAPLPKPNAAVAPPPKPSRPAPIPKPAPSAPAPAPATGGYLVQVGAFSSRANAENAARAVSGHVVPTGALFRVQIGPFREASAAQRARDAAASRGYADAHILRK